MAEIVWTDAALADLTAIAEYIALESPIAASALVRRVFEHVEQLAAHPASGSKPLELGKSSRYRQIVEPPCRLFYRHEKKRVYILYVMRSEQLLRPRLLAARVSKRTTKKPAKR